MQPEIIEIALVDDHRLFRSGIASLVNQLPGFNILFEAGNGLELIEKISSKIMPQIILLDIKMPEMDGFTSTEWLKKTYPDVKIVILSMFQDAEKVLAMVKLGVQGYILKDAEPEEFSQALRQVAKGESYYPPFVTRHLVSNFNKPDAKIILNNKEIEFLKLAGTELTYKEIADKMYLSVRTIDGYRDQLFEKLNIKSRVGLALYAVKNKLIDL